MSSFASCLVLSCHCDSSITTGFANWHDQRHGFLPSNSSENGALLYVSITDIDYAITDAPEFDALLPSFQQPLVEMIQDASHLELGSRESPLFESPCFEQPLIETIQDASHLELGSCVSPLFHPTLWCRLLPPRYSLGLLAIFLNDCHCFSRFFSGRTTSVLPSQHWDVSY